MALTGLQLAQLALQGLIEGATSGLASGGVPEALDAANSLQETELFWTKTADDANINATTAEFVLGVLPRRSRLVAATYVPSDNTGLTANAANYATLTIQARSSATNGLVTSPNALSSTNTTPTANGGTGNWTQWNSVPLNVAAFDPTNTVVPVGAAVTFQIAKTAPGITVPAGTLMVRLQYI